MLHLFHCDYIISVDDIAILLTINYIQSKLPKSSRDIQLDDILYTDNSPSDEVHLSGMHPLILVNVYCFNLFYIFFNVL